MRLDAFLAARLRRYSRARVQRMIDAGLVTRGGRGVKAAARVLNDETILIRYPRTEEPPVPHETMPLLFLDDRLAVIAKPGGTLSHPTDKIHQNTVTTLLAKQLGARVFLPHRLDRETSGAMVVARDSDAARSLYEQFLARTVRKEYLAVVRGDVSWQTRVVDAPISAEGGEIKVRRLAGADGQPAVTEFRRLAGDGARTLVSARPKTGRLHQIRVHLAFLGHPVLGDKLYMNEGAAYMKAVRKELTAEDLLALGAERQLLHAWKLSFEHPTDGRRREFTAPIPDDFPFLPEAA